MAVAFWGGGALLGSTGADISPGVSANAVGQVTFLQACARSNAVTLATPAGWNLIAGPIDTGTTWRTYWFWRAYQPGDPATVLCDWSGTTGHKYGRTWTFTGCDTSNPIAASARTAGTADPGVATGVTTTAASQYVASMGMSADNVATAVTTTATDPASLPQDFYTTIATGADCGGWLAHGTRATAGATGNVSHDFNGAPLAWSILIAALKEAAAVTTVSPASITHTRGTSTPTVSPQVRPAGQTHTRAVGTPTVSTTVAPAGVAHTRAVGSPAVQVGSTVSPASVVHTRGSSTPTVNASVAGASVVHARGTGTPSIHPKLAPASVSHTRGQGAVTVTAGANVAPASVVHTRAIGSPAVNVTISPTSGLHSRAIGTPTVSPKVYPAGIVHGREVGTPSLPGFEPEPGSPKLIIHVG
jgi:hypothetical protein